MSPILTGLLLALIALVGARLTFGAREVPLGPRIFVAIGGPFPFLGFALGPHVAGLLTPAMLGQLTPLVALGLGWIGVLFGLQLDRSHLRLFPLRYLGLAWLQALVAFALVFAVGYAALARRLAPGLDAVVTAAAATACVSTPAAIALISNTYRARGPVTRLLFYVGSLDAAVGIAILGLVHAAYDTGPFGRGVLSAPERFLMSIVLGVLFGVLFLSLTRIRPNTQELVLLLIGLVLFAAGTAVYLGLAPLFVAMIAGAVIGNLSPMRRRIYAALAAWEKPIYIMTLVLAGALLRFPSWWIVPLVLAYTAARVSAKWVAGLLVARLGGAEARVPRDFGLGLAPQGGLSLAMAISFILIYVPSVSELETALALFFATVAIGVGISDVVGPFFVRAVLRRAGELQRDIAGARA